MRRFKDVILIVVALVCVLALIAWGKKASQSLSETMYFFYNVGIMYILSMVAGAITIRDYIAPLKKASRFALVFLAVSAVFCFYGLGLGYGIINIALGLITSAIIFIVSKLSEDRSGLHNSPHL